MKAKVLSPILLILSLIFVGSYYTIPDNLNNSSMRMDTVFVDKTDTVSISDIIRDTMLLERVDTLIVVVTEDLRDTTFVRDIVYVDSLVGTYDRNETNLNHNITRTHRQVGVGQHEVTYSWNSDATFNDLNWICLGYDAGEWNRLTDTSVTLPYQESEQYKITIGDGCNERLYVYIWSQDRNWSIRWDDFLDLGKLDSLYREEQNSN